jgi:outer membrane protein OmpA-like peptidoglycan-associated protein
MNRSTTRRRVSATVLAALTLAAMTLGTVALAGPASATSGTPSAPAISSVTSAAPNTASVLLTWSAPTSKGTSAVKAYVLQYATSSTFTGVTLKNLPDTPTTATLTLPTEGTYFLRVAAANTAGVGAYSTSVKVVYGVIGTTGGTNVDTCATGTLTGTNCVTTTTTPAIAEPTYSCPPGKQLTGGDCFVVTQYAATATPTYQEECPSGWVADASSECSRFTTTTQASCANNSGTWVGGTTNNCELFTAKVLTVTGETYSCNGSDVLSGTTCTNIVSSPATQGPPYTYGCVSPAVLSGATCTTTTTTPATLSTSPPTTIYGYTEASSSTTTTTTPGSTTTTTTTVPKNGLLHLSKVVTPFAINSAHLSAKINFAIATLVQSVVHLPKGDTVVSVGVRGYADPNKAKKYNHALALSRAHIVATTFAKWLASNGAYTYTLNVSAGGTTFAKSAKEKGSVSHRRVVITVNYTR